MKETEKIKQISISAILIILMIVAGLFTFNNPSTNYANNMEGALKDLVDQPNLISLDDYHKTVNTSITIDVRNAAIYAKGHLENAINIPLSRLLATENIAIFNQANNENHEIVFYGSTAMQANNASVFLRQIGFENTHVLAIETCFKNQIFSKKTVLPAQLLTDIPAFIKKSNERKKVVIKKVSIKKPSPKKIIPIRKKKKYESEGGC